MKVKCKLINTSIPDEDWDMLQIAANGIGWPKARVQKLDRYGFSKARIYIVRAPAGHPEIPHVVKVAAREATQKELKGYELAKSRIRNLHPFDGFERGELGVICYPLLTVGTQDGPVADAADIYDRSLKGSDQGAPRQLCDLIDSALKHLEDNHRPFKKQPKRELGATLNSYLRMARPSRIDRVFDGGAKLSICGFEVRANPRQYLDAIMAVRSSGFTSFFSHGDLHLSNIVVDREAANPGLIDFAWSSVQAHGLIDFVMLESSLRFMRFPQDIPPQLMLEVDRRLNSSLDVEAAEAILDKASPSGKRLMVMLAAVKVVRTYMRKAFSSHDPAELQAEFSRVLYLILAGQEKIKSFPLMRTIVNLDQLGEAATR